MKCPACGVLNPDNKGMCSCGYDLSSQTRILYSSFDNMGVWKHFSNSWRTLGVAWNTFLLLGVISTIISVLPGYLSELLFSLDEMVVIVVGNSIIFLIYLILLSLTTMAIIITTHQASEGKSITIKDSYSLALSWTLFWRYVFTWILYFLIVIAGSLLLVIPGIIWGIRYALAPHAVIVEGLGVRQALSRSSALTDGRKSQIFSHELGFGLLILLFSLPLFLLLFLLPLPIESELDQVLGQIIYINFWIFIANLILFKSLRISLNESAVTKVLPLGKPTFGWPEIKDASSYELKVTGPSGFNFFQTLPSNQLSFAYDSPQLPQLKDKGTYELRIEAKNASGEIINVSESKFDVE